MIISEHLIGEIFLDISFLLYLFLYPPQVYHNFRYHKVRELSFGFHTLIVIASTTDLYYAFGRIAQWQYRAASVLTFVCLMIQHVQWLLHADKTRYKLLNWWLLTALIITLLVGLFVVLYIHPESLRIYIIAGWIERLCGWTYTIPQIIKNSRQHSAASISPVYASIAVITIILDTTAAWVFHWGSPSLYGTPISLAMHTWLLLQCFLIKKKLKQNNF